MVSYLTVNLVVAVTTYATCLLLPIVLEHAASHEGHAEGSWGTWLGGSTSSVLDAEAQRTRLSVPSLGITMRGLQTSEERIEAAHRARSWLETLDGCASSPKLCGPAKYMTAGDLLVRASKQLAYDSDVPPQVAVVTSVWYGAFSASLMHAAGAVDTVAVGSTTACAAFLATTRISGHDRVKCLEGHVVHPLVSECTGPSSCAFHHQLAASEPSRGAAGALPPTLMFDVAHRAPRVVLIDLEPTSIGLTVFALAQALTWLHTDHGRHSVVATMWRTEGGVQRTDNATGAVGNAPRGDADALEAFNTTISFAMLHGDCVAPDDTARSTLRPLQASLVAAFLSPTHASARFAKRRKTCFMVFRNAAEEALRPLSTIVNAENLPRLGMPFLHTRPLHRPDRPRRADDNALAQPTTWGTTILNGAFLMVAVGVGVALCYGIGKNWFCKRKRRNVVPLQQVV